MTITRWAEITLRFEGFHCYPGAPEEVKFLENVHRHLFHVTVWIEQSHNFRDLEYFIFKRRVEALWKQASFMLEASCEQMADTLGRTIGYEFPGRRIKVRVSEDGENGALLEFDIA